MILMEEDQRGRPIVAREDWANGIKVAMDGTNKSVTLPARCSAVEITNDSGFTIYARGDASAAVAGSGNTKPIFNKSWRAISIAGGLNMIGDGGDVFVMPVLSAPS